MHIEGDIVVSIKHVAERGKNVAKMVTCLTEMVIHPIIFFSEMGSLLRGMFKGGMSPMDNVDHDGYRLQGKNHGLLYLGEGNVATLFKA